MVFDVPEVKEEETKNIDAVDVNVYHTALDSVEPQDFMKDKSIASDKMKRSTIRQSK